ncbi:MAG: hypothetical protein ACXWZS_10440, partial [Gemmatirosa sp.]
GSGALMIAEHLPDRPEREAERSRRESEAQPSKAGCRGSPPRRPLRGEAARENEHDDAESFHACLSVEV